jgi:organic hydroperoxide reductase OsmC/OhrA
MGKHEYNVQVDWSGNDGEGTRTYAGYRRDHTISFPGKPPLAGSSDPHFRGDAQRYNPEEFLVAALSSCHMLTYLHLCANHGVVVSAYSDKAHGVMTLQADGTGAFSAVTLRPEVTVKRGSDPGLARRLHDEAHHTCWIANSVNFAVSVEARVRIESAASAGE